MYSVIILNYLTMNIFHLYLSKKLTKKVSFFSLIVELLSKFIQFSDYDVCFLRTIEIKIEVRVWFLSILSGIIEKIFQIFQFFNLRNCSKEVMFFSLFNEIKFFKTYLDCLS